jgi:MarR family transcriptional regulator, lower aerobic nicotinate degradation pathway regulator
MNDPDALPHTLASRAAYLLTRAAIKANAMGEGDLEPLGISPREYGVLEVLAHHSPLSQTRVAAILGLDRTTILKLGASLERKGLVIRERDEQDRRAYALALSPAGDRIREQAFTLLLDCEERLLTPLAGEERAELTDMLSRIVEM